MANENNVVIGIVGKHYNIDKKRTDTYIRDEVKQAIFDNGGKHNKPDEEYVHSININKDSKFYNIIGKDTIKVNSRHKNTIDNAGGQDKVAFCDDGYSDVIESNEKEFYIGVRFHPESLYKIDVSHNKIFKEFITICGN